MTDTPYLLGLIALVALAISVAGGSVLVPVLLRFADSRVARIGTTRRPRPDPAPPPAPCGAAPRSASWSVSR